MDKIEALKERLHQWIANAEKNRLNNMEKFSSGEIGMIEYHDRKNLIDGQIYAYKETLMVL